MIDPERVKPKITKKIFAQGEDKKSLLYNFLEQFLILLDTENFILHKVKKIKIIENKLTAEVIGDFITEKYELKSDVKAVTYNEMEIK